MYQFNSDEEIKKYIESSIKSIELLNECRLYKEEQLQITKEVMNVRNSIEWIIRINKVIKNFTYAIIKSYDYAILMESPLEETENARMYSFYLEDAVYRDIVLWDLLRQFLNEFYDCGYDIGDEISIFAFLKQMHVCRKIGNSKVRKLKRYLSGSKHQEVRNRLRNQFTHSLDGTSSYIFHRVKQGKIQADMSKVFPMHPYENIVCVLDDMKKYLEFANTYINELETLLVDCIMLVEVKCYFKCGKLRKDTGVWSINILKDKAEQILCPCENHCKEAIEYQGNWVCKPLEISYCRIYEEEEKYKGKITLHMDYEKMKYHFTKNEITK